MTTYKLITEKDVDNKSVVINEKKLESRLVFGPRTAEVDLLANGQKLLFREILNGDDRTAVCTGYFDGSDWNLDSPTGTGGRGWEPASSGGAAPQPEPAPPPPPPEVPGLRPPTATLSLAYSNGREVSQQCLFDDSVVYWISTGQTITLTAQFNNLEESGLYILEPFKGSPLLELGTVTVGRVTGDISVNETSGHFALDANGTEGSAEFVLTINKEVRNEQPTTSHTVGIGSNGIDHDAVQVAVGINVCTY